MKVSKLVYFVSETPVEGSSECVNQTFSLDPKAKFSIFSFISFVLPFLSGRIKNAIEDNRSSESGKVLKSRQLTIKIFYGDSF